MEHIDAILKSAAQLILSYKLIVAFLIFQMSLIFYTLLDCHEAKGKEEWIHH